MFNQCIKFCGDESDNALLDAGKDSINNTSIAPLASASNASDKLPEDAKFDGAPLWWLFALFISWIPIAGSMAFHIWESSPKGGGDDDDGEHSDTINFSVAGFADCTLCLFRVLGSVCHGLLKHSQEGVTIRRVIETLLSDVGWINKISDESKMTFAGNYRKRVDFLKVNELGGTPPNFFRPRSILPYSMVILNAAGQAMLTGMKGYLLLSNWWGYYQDDDSVSSSAAVRALFDSSSSGDEVADNIYWGPMAIAMILAGFKFFTEVFVGGPTIADATDKMQQLAYWTMLSIGSGLGCVQLRGGEREYRDNNYGWKPFSIYSFGRAVAAAGTLGFVYKGWGVTNDVFKLFGMENADVILGVKISIGVGMIFGGQGLPASRVIYKLALSLFDGRHAVDQNGPTREEIMQWFNHGFTKHYFAFPASLGVAGLGAFTTGSINAYAIKHFIQKVNPDVSSTALQGWQMAAWGAGSVTNLVTQSPEFIETYGHRDKGTDWVKFLGFKK